MPIELAILQKGLLDLQPGLPHNYTGLRMQGGAACFVTRGFGEIILQEINELQYTIRHNIFSVAKKTRFSFNRRESGLQTTAVLNDSCRKTINGAGRFKIRQGYFTSLFTSAWSGVLECRTGSHLVSFDTTWTDELLQQFLPQDSDWWSLLKNEHTGIPKLVGAPYRPITPALQHLIRELQHSPYDDSLAAHRIEYLLKEYLVQVLQQVSNPDWLSETISKADAEKIEQAKSMIAANPFKYVQSKDLATATGMNECKLKSLFVKATGMGTFDYMMHLRCQSLKQKILDSDVLIKTLVYESGYSDLANFVNGFKRHMGCTPGEIRDTKFKG